MDADHIEHASRVGELDGMLVASLASDLGPAGLESFARAVLERLSQMPRRVVVLDCSAVPLMDSHEFGQLIDLGAMCRMLGARTYLAALHPGIAIHLALTLTRVPELRFCRDIDHARSLAQQEGL